MRLDIKLIFIVCVIGVALAACAAKNEPTMTMTSSDLGGINITQLEPIQYEAKRRVELEFTKPDAVRGIYVNGHSAGGERLTTLLDLLDKTDLNAMVIDIKDDYGNITYEPDKNSPLAPIGKPYIKDPRILLKTLQKHNIYPIARIVVFKDSVFADKNPGLSFLTDDTVWRNNRGEAFVNPFLQEVWEHNLAIAKEAARMGFQEIQFDYVRFPEGFESLADKLTYEKGEYADAPDAMEARVHAVTDFVAYAKEELAVYDVDVSVDVFGYTVTVPYAPGIGQDIVKIGEHIDVLSSMIYPSHWGPGNLGVAKPDLDPYQLVHNYIAKEKERLYQMDPQPISRPWIQDFTASWLGQGNYMSYGRSEVEAQIRALNEAGVDEYLIWNAGNYYSKNVDYTPELDSAVIKKVKEADAALLDAMKNEGESRNDPA